MPTYYVDNSSPTASDQNSGLSPNAAFQSLSALNSRTFSPGDIIEFKSGTAYTGGLVVSSSGTASTPITFTTYGGNIQPTISNSGIWSNAVSVNGASYVVFDGIGVNGAHQAGYYVNSNSSHITIKNSDMTGVGEGVLLEGNSNLVVNNYIHDLHMVVNTTGASTDDYGANGVVIAGTQNTITGNLILRAKASSYDWGSDGGAFELFGTVDGTQITNNWVQASQGFLEAGGQPGHAYNITVSNNVSVDNGSFLTLHNSGGEFGAQFRSFVVDHNTIVERQNTSTSSAEIFLDGPATPDSISFTSNVVWLNNGDSIFKTVGGYHSNNVFNLLSPTTHIYNNWDNTLGSGEILADPGFQSLANLQLKTSSAGPAAGLGAQFAGATIQVPTQAQLIPNPPEWTDLRIPVSPDQPPTQTPILSVHDVAVAHNSLVPISSLFSLTDASRTPVQYQFVDWNKNGYLVFNGVVQATGTPVEVSPEHLSQVSVYAGVGTDSIQVLGFDGTYWSGANTTVAGTNSPPSITIHPGSGVPGQSVLLSTFASIADAEGDQISSYKIVDWSNGPGAGYLVVDGQRVAASTTLILTPAQFAQASYVYGTAGDAVALQAFDGMAWSDWSSFTTNPISPVVSKAIGTQSAAPGAAFNLSVTSDFLDRNPGGSLSFIAKLGDGSALPNWLKFTNGVFSGTPGASDGGATLDVVVTASDQGSVSTDFILNVSTAPPPDVHVADIKPVAMSTLSPSNLFTATDAIGSIQAYQFVDWWNTPTSGHFILAGVSQPSATTIQVAASDLGSLSYFAGSSHDLLAVRAFDGANWSSWGTFNVDPQAGNLAPTVAAPISNQQDTVGTAFSLNIGSNFSDPNGDALSYSATLANGAALPGWLHFTNGVFSGTPGAADVASLQVKVTATDPSSLSVSNTFGLTVAAAQQAPVVAVPIANQQDTVGTAFSLNIGSNFSDPNGDALSYTATLANGAALPNWLHFTNGVFSGTPGAGDVASLQVKVTATDPSSLSVSNTFGLNVHTVSQVVGPVVQVSDLKPVSGSTVLASTLFSASDATGTIQTYEFVDWWNTPTSGHFVLGGASKPEATTFQIAASSLSTLSFYAGSSHDLLAVRAFDGANWSSWGTFNVDPQAGNLAPTVAAPISNQQDTVGTAFSLNVGSNFSDPNGDALSYTATLANGAALPGWLHFTNGVFSGTPGAGDVAALQVEVTATDPSSLSVSNTFGLTVAAAQQAPVVAVPIANQQDTVGTAFSLNIGSNFSDPNGDALSYTATLANGAALPGWLHFTNGVFSGTPGAGDVASLQVKVTATDPSSLSVSNTFGLTVAAAQQAPVVAAPIANQQDTVGTAFSLSIGSNFSDPNGDALSYTATLANGAALPGWLHFTNGVFSGTPGAGDVASLQVKVTATDPSSLSVSNTFGLTVAAAQQAPVVAVPIANQQDTVGTAFSLSIGSNFSDPNGDALSYTATLANGAALPGWLHFTNGVFSGTPGAGDVASLQVKVTATDPSSLSVSNTFGLNVHTVSQVVGPVVQVSDLKPVSGSTVLASTLFSASDATGTIQTYEFVDWWNTPTSGHFVLGGASKPEATTFQIAASSLSTLSFYAGSSHDLLAVRAFDGANWSSWGTFNVDPQAGNLAPTVAAPIASQQDTVGTAFSLNIGSNFSDPNGDALSYSATLANGSALPGWLHFTNGVFSGTPGAGDVASLQVKVTATDPSSLSVSNTFGLTVAAAQQAPVVAVPIANQQDTVGTAFSLNIGSNFSDPNGDALSYTATLANGSALPGWLHFTNGVFSGTPGAGDVASLQVKVTATDPSSLSVSNTFGLDVHTVSQVVGPVVQVSDLKPVSGSTVLASTLFSASDATGTIQTYEFVDWWNTPTSGHFILAGASKPESAPFQIAASDLANLSFYAGSSHDLLAVRAFDGSSWSSWGTFNFDPM